jgi:hypothetical protein
MFILSIVLMAALVLGLLIPTRFGVLGFIGATAILFFAQVAMNTAMGFAGSSIADSLLLFNGSYAAYVGFNAQITYRAFALPELLLALAFIARLRRTAL